MKKEPQSDELSIIETAAMLGVSIPTVYDFVKRKLITKRVRPYGKGRGGRRVYFLRTEVEALATKR